MTKKEQFIDYLTKFDGDAFPMRLGEIIISFAGSDGPDILEDGVDAEDGMIYFEETEKIDEYIEDCCTDNYATTFCKHKTNLQTLTWTEYTKNELYMLTKEQHQIVADVLELAEAEGNEFVKAELILYASQCVKGGETSVDSILSHFLDETY